MRQALRSQTGSGVLGYANNLFNASAGSASKVASMTSIRCSLIRAAAVVSAAAVLLFASLSSAAVYNLKVVTDASPDYSDMESMIRSITAKWETPEQKCWA